MDSFRGFAATVATNTNSLSSSHLNERNHIVRLPYELKLGITQHLSISDLGHLAQTSKLFYGFIIPILYTKDSQGKRPRAIYWAVSADLSEVCHRSLMRVLDLAIKYGSDVNKVYRQERPHPFYATPLHLAAASGKISVVKKLLKHNADPNAFGKDFLYDLQQPLDPWVFESSTLNNGIAVASRYTKWRPLFVPFVMEQEEMVQILLKYGASPVLAVTDFESGSINVLHIVASRQTRQYTDVINLSYFKKYANLIHEPLPRGEAPLFIALRHGDESTLRSIISNGGDITGVSELGRTPLTQAITYFYKGQTPAIRKGYVDIICYLINSCNISVGKHLDARVLQTPLTCAVMGLAEISSADWASIVKDIMPIIDLLLDRGAEVNEVSSHGYTILNALCHVICERKKHSGVLLDLFEQLVRKRGADLSSLFPNGHSMLGACITSYDCKPSKFYNILLELGATIIPQEADAVFKYWAGSSTFRNASNFNIFNYSEHITQDAVDSAYKICINKGEKILDLLQSHFPNTTIPERIASEALIHDENHNKRFKAALKFENFNGRYVHTDGNSLLHLIVDRLENKLLKYTDSQATADAREVLWLGASVEAKDDWGRTALDKLMHTLIYHGRGNEHLRHLLQDIKGGTEFLRKCYKENQDAYDEKYKELIDMAS
ncbi:hypothetical protein ACHAQJ_001697 [Trichoderma viride]